MGSGKSTIGKELADMLALPLIEMDSEIEKLAGKSISAIFKEEGEIAFRKLETCVLGSSLQRKGIIATGGGVVTRNENLSLLSKEKRGIYLKGDMRTLQKRIENDFVNKRPLAKDKVSLERLFESRKAAYEAIATITIIIDQKSIFEILEEIKEKGLIE